MKTSVCLFFLLSFLSFEIQSSSSSSSGSGGGGGGSALSVVDARRRAVVPSSRFNPLGDNIIKHILTYLHTRDAAGFFSADRFLARFSRNILGVPRLLRLQRPVGQSHEGPSSVIKHVVVLPNDQIVVGTNRGKVYIFSPNSQRKIVHFETNLEISGLAFNPNLNKLIVLCGSSCVFLDATDPRQSQHFNVRSGCASITHLGENMYAFGCNSNNDGIVNISNLQQKNLPGLLNTKQIVQNPQNPHVIAISYKNSQHVSVWNVQGDAPVLLRKIKTIANGPLLLFNPDGVLLTNSTNCDMQFFNVETGAALPITAYKLKTDVLDLPVKIICWITMQDGSIAAGYSDGKIRILDIVNGVQICREIIGKGKAVHSLCQLPDGRLAAGKCEGRLEYYITKSHIDQLKAAGNMTELDKLLGSLSSLVVPNLSIDAQQAQADRHAAAEFSSSSSSSSSSSISSSAAAAAAVVASAAAILTAVFVRVVPPVVTQFGQ